MDCGHWSSCSSHPSMKELGQIVCTHNKVQTGQSNPVLQLHEFYAARNFSSPKLVCDREKEGESGSLLLGFCQIILPRVCTPVSQKMGFE